MYYINKIKFNLSNWLDYFKEHFLRIIFMLILFIIFFIAFFFIPKANNMNNNVLAEQHILIFGITLNNWFTYISMVALIITAIWAVYQFDKNNTLRQQEKASEIAKSFSDKLTIKCSIICTVIKNSSLYEFLKLDSKEYDDFKIFNTSEIRNVYKDDDFIEKYKKIKSDSNLNLIYYRILDSLISNESFKELTEKNKNYSIEEARALFILDNSCLPFRFEALIYNVLNELEYLCMSLSSHAAGSKYVYQSLHQFFLRTMRCLAIEIAISNNNNYSDKFYVNAIHVYNEWTNLYTLNSKKEKKLKSLTNSILNPKIKAV